MKPGTLIALNAIANAQGMMFVNNGADSFQLYDEFVSIKAELLDHRKKDYLVKCTCASYHELADHFSATFNGREEEERHLKDHNGTIVLYDGRTRFNDFPSMFCKILSYIPWYKKIKQDIYIDMIRNNNNKIK